MENVCAAVLKAFGEFIPEGTPVGLAARMLTRMVCEPLAAWNPGFLVESLWLGDGRDVDVDHGRPSWRSRLTTQRGQNGVVVRQQTASAPGGMRSCSAGSQLPSPRMNAWASAMIRSALQRTPLAQTKDIRYQPVDHVSLLFPFHLVKVYLPVTHIQVKKPVFCLVKARLHGRKHQGRVGRGDELNRRILGDQVIHDLQNGGGTMARCQRG